MNSNGTHMQDDLDYRSPDDDECSDLAVDLASGALSPREQARARARMLTDARFRAIAQPILDSWNATPLAADEVDARWKSLRRRTATASATPRSVNEAKPSYSVWRAPRTYAMIAATIAIVALPAALLRDTTPPPKDIVVATTGQHQTVQLPDGGSVLLSPYSQITYSESLAVLNPRLVAMKGTAVFVVAHRDNQPFIATAHLVKVTAVGTRFMITVAEPFTMVTVGEGTVLVQALDSLGHERGKPYPVDIVRHSAHVTEKDGIIDAVPIAPSIHQGGLP